METLDAIHYRRSIRRYTGKPISDEDLEIILKAGVMAPSGLNLQPWYFVAVKSEEKKQKLYQIMRDVCERIVPELKGRFPKHPEIVAETTQFIHTLGNAPVVLLVFLQKTDYAESRTALLSTAAAVENVLLAARDKNIGSCWLAAAEQTGYGDKIRDFFAPGKGDLVATVTLGYTENWPKAIERRAGRYIVV